MKRLTDIIAPGYEYILVEGDGYDRDNAITKLGKYEDTGLEPEEIGKWIPVNKQSPENETLVLVCFDDGFVTTANYDGDWELWADAGEVLAWMPLPRPYNRTVVKCKRCGFDFRENELTDAYKYQGDIYCEGCLKPIETIIHYKLGDDYDPIEVEEVEEVYLNHGYLEE